jgi:hypothetical protein
MLNLTAGGFAKAGVIRSKLRFPQAGLAGATLAGAFGFAALTSADSYLIL